MAADGCERCSECEARLQVVLQERDAALLACAQAREALAAEQLRARWQHEEEIPAYPFEAGVAWPVPLRYRAVDRLHGWVKRAVPGAPRLARRLLGRRGER